jgi:ribosomal protein S18 acetylase RimI-like enzyme
MTGSTILVERLERFERTDLSDLCDAAEAAIEAGGGFGWVRRPQRRALEAYWKGVVLVPERQLVIGRLDSVIAAAAQMVRPPRNNEAQGFMATLTHAFVAPWARGHGLARAITLEIEALARRSGARVLNLDLRETQTAAIRLYERLGYRCWGINPLYAEIDGRIIPGRYYHKLLEPAEGESAAGPEGSP